MEGQVPGGVPGVLPLVRHGEDVFVVQVFPVAVAAAAPLRRGRRLTGVAPEPFRHVVAVELLVPDHAGQGLALNGAGIGVVQVRLQFGVELVGLPPPPLQDLPEVLKRFRLQGVRQTEAEPGRAACGDRERVVERRPGAGPGGVDGVAPAVNDGIVEGVLEMARGAVAAEQPGRIRLVVAEQQGRSAVAVNPVTAQLLVVRLHGPVRRGRQDRPVGPVLPRPGVAEPDLRQQVEGGGVRAAVVGRDLQEQVVRPGLGVLDKDVEVATIVEDAGVEQFVLRPAPAATVVLLDQVRVRELPLRILVEHLQEGVRRRGVEVVVQLLDVLAVVALGVGQAEEAFLEDGVAAVPQGERQAQALAVVADAGEAVLPPAIGPAARQVVREVRPGVAVGAVVLADGAPLALAQVRPPAAPRLPAETVLLQTLAFGARGPCPHGGPLGAGRSLSRTPPAEWYAVPG
jgi:hypothetical protein